MGCSCFGGTNNKVSPLLIWMDVDDLLRCELVIMAMMMMMMMMMMMTPTTMQGLAPLSLLTRLVLYFYNHYTTTATATPSTPTGHCNRSMINHHHRHHCGIIITTFIMLVVLLWSRAIPAFPLTTTTTIRLLGGAGAKGPLIRPLRSLLRPLCASGSSSSGGSGGNEEKEEGGSVLPGIRINKCFAKFASRREADRLVATGRVKVNGKVRGEEEEEEEE